ITGMLAGSYPSLFLSSFKVVNILKGTLKFDVREVFMRKGLVIFQFSLSILLIIATLVVYQQMNYMKGKKLGMEKENLIYMSMNDKMKNSFHTVRNELMQNPGVEAVCSSDQSPLAVYNSTTDPEWEGMTPDQKTPFSVIKTDENFVSTMKIQIKEGRNFSQEFSLDSNNFLINETAAKVMGLTDPLNKGLAVWGREGKIIGVMNDFHIGSLHSPIKPVILTFRPEDCWMLFVKTKSGQTESAISSLSKVHQEYNPEFPFEYQFVDQKYEQLYKSEMVISQLANIFAFIAMFIACLGLLGLATFTAERRSREISIRKVLGASVPELVVLLSEAFIRLVIVSVFISVPIGYFLMKNWLENFAYHTDLSVSLFIISGVMAIIIAWLTVSYQSIKAAILNPINSLRSE
ncbi:MAG: ABC transporter permease, partial [Bacteroidetes bacterium]|nr:ABC transporter permease [Bacteroidota bacterium]